MSDIPELDSERFSHENRRRLSGAGLRTFIGACDLWQVPAERRPAILGKPSAAEYLDWKRKAEAHEEDLALDTDVLMRISATLGIQAALVTLFQTNEERREWLFSPHSAKPFHGRAPIDLMTGGSFDDLISVRRFLDGACQGLYMSPNEVDNDRSTVSH